MGALFLDVNKIQIHDEDKWFDNVFVTGPGFQMAQIFIEKVFEKHVNWTELIEDDTYVMGVYLCLGQNIHNLSPDAATNYSEFNNFQEIHEYIQTHNSCFIFLGQGVHKIKKKAEQEACEVAINNIIEFQ